MGKTKVGRVFFEPDSGPDVEKVTVLTLDSHVANVVTLVEKFRRDFYQRDLCRSVEGTRELLIRAAKKHDDAKPETFRVTYRGWKENGRKSLGYSFAGHRFRVADDERYVELLIRLHHEFSVAGIVEAQNVLRTELPTRGQAKNFPIDLYILEMCDQIEAEVETYAFTGSVQPRVFMDFHSRLHEDGQRVEIEPYPFEDTEIRLSLAFYELDFGKTVPEERQRIVKALKNDKSNEACNRLRKVITAANQHAECQYKDMILCKAH